MLFIMILAQLDPLTHLFLEAKFKHVKFGLTEHIHVVVDFNYTYQFIPYSKNHLVK